MITGSGFQAFRPEDGAVGLWVRVQFPSAELDRFIEATRVSGVMIAPSWSEPASGLGFLARFKDQLRGLTVAAEELKDLSVVSRLTNLEVLSLECPADGLDFSQLLRLRKCFLGRPASLGNVGSATALESLALHGLKTEELTELRTLKALRYLHLTSLPRLRSLEELESLQLEELRLAYLSRLRTIASIGHSTSLEVLEVMNCKHIRDFEVVGTLTALRVLRIWRGPTLPSFYPLGQLSRLVELGLWATEVIQTPTSIAPLTHLVNLRVLKLLSGIKRATDLERLGELRALVCLMLGRGPVLPSLSFLGGLGNLEELAITRTRIRDADRSVLAGLPKLRRVHGLGQPGVFDGEAEARWVDDFESVSGVADAAKAEVERQGLKGPFELRVGVGRKSFAVMGRVVRGRVRIEMVIPTAGDG